MPKGTKGFQKGNKLGRGRPPIDKAMEEARRVDREFIRDRIQSFLLMQTSTLKEKAADPELSVIDRLIIAVIVKTQSQGDHSRLNFLFEQVAGKLTDKLDLNAKKKVIFSTTVQADGTLLREFLDDEGDESGSLDQNS